MGKLSTEQYIVKHNKSMSLKYYNIRDMSMGHTKDKSTILFLAHVFRQTSLVGALSSRRLYLAPLAPSSFATLTKTTWRHVSQISKTLWFWRWDKIHCQHSQATIIPISDKIDIVLVFSLAWCLEKHHAQRPFFSLEIINYIVVNYLFKNLFEDTHVLYFYSYWHKYFQINI